MNAVPWSDWLAVACSVAYAAYCMVLSLVILSGSDVNDSPVWGITFNGLLVPYAVTILHALLRRPVHPGLRQMLHSTSCLRIQENANLFWCLGSVVVFLMLATVDSFAALASETGGTVND